MASEKEKTENAVTIEEVAQIVAELPPQRVEYVLGYAQGVISCQRERETKAETKKKKPA